MIVARSIIQIEVRLCIIVRVLPFLIQLQERSDFAHQCSIMLLSSYFNLLFKHVVEVSRLRRNWHGSIDKLIPSRAQCGFKLWTWYPEVDPLHLKIFLFNHLCNSCGRQYLVIAHLCRHHYVIWVWRHFTSEHVVPWG
jgi:hypothetical protein